MRQALAFILALVAFFGIDYSLQRLGSSLGIASHITYNEPVVREANDQTYEVFGETTAVGYAISAFSVVVAVWLAKSINAGSRWKLAFSATGRRWWLAWLFGTALLVTLLGAASYLLSALRFPYKSYAVYAVQGALILSVAWYFFRWGTRQSAAVPPDEV